MAEFSTLWQEVRLSIGQRLDIDTEIKAAVNDAMVELPLLFDIPEAQGSATFTTVAETNTYDVTDTVKEIISVRNVTDAVPLTLGDAEDMSKTDFEDADQVGTPTKWYPAYRPNQAYIILYANTPDDSDFEIRYQYIKRFADMADDTDVFPYPREWERPLKLLAKSYVLELLGQSDKALQAFQQCTGVVNMRTGPRGRADIERGDNRINFDARDEEY
jgi:hypothetical protein